MKSFLKKHTQSIAVGFIALIIGGGIVAAAPLPTMVNFSKGFIRIATEGLGYFRYGYGYGYIGQLFGYGYGYGYDRVDRWMHLGRNLPADRDPAFFGFLGDDGAATIDNLEIHFGEYQYGVRPSPYIFITYSTSYLAKSDIALYPSVGFDQEKNEYTYNPNLYSIYNEEHEYVSGPRTMLIGSLVCDQYYYVTIRTVDAGGNNWKSDGVQFTTEPCDERDEEELPTPPSTPEVVPTTGAYSRGGAATSFYPTSPITLPTPPINPNVPKPTSLPISPILRQGASGPGPKLLQKTLNYLGFTVSSSGAGSPGNETEFFGPKTRAALGKFQSAYGLKPDGIYGPATKAILNVLIK